LIFSIRTPLEIRYYVKNDISKPSDTTGDEISEWDQKLMQDIEQHVVIKIVGLRNRKQAAAPRG
jgi:hypothetical protein